MVGKFAEHFMLKRRDKAEKVKLSPDAFKKARRIFGYMRPYRGVYIIGWMCLIASSILSMLFPALMGQLLGANDTDQAIYQSETVDLTNINVILAVLLIVFAVQAIFSFLRIILFNYVTENSLRDIKSKAFSTLVHLPIDFYNQNKVGELSSRLATDVNLIQETLNTTLAEFFRQIITIIVALSFLFFMSWQLALWMLAVIPVLAVVAIIFGRTIKKFSKRSQDVAAASNAVIEEVLSGIKSVKSFTNERHEENRYGEKVNELKNLNIKRGVIRAFFVSFIIIGMFGGIAFVIWKAKGMESEGLITMAEFNAFILYTIFLGASFGSIPDLYAKVQKAIGSTERLMDLVEEKQESAEGQEVKELRGDVAFKEVSFSYPQRKEIQVLNNLSFSCKAGESVALVGSSGAGKSTISSLLLNFYQVQEGDILFDSQSIREISKDSLRSNIAIVPQEVLLFSGSIYDNIKYGRLDATEEEVKEAAKQANAFDFIMSFPDGFETEVGDRGIQLSGGQKQRIAIARAVLKDPAILILDEATSALDAESEQQVQIALEKLMQNRTSFVIAHRLSTVRNADHILVLENGQIVQKGRHEELIADESGTYFQLNNIQLS